MTQQINLLEPALRPTRQWCRGRDVLLAGGALAAAVLAHHQFERRAMAQMLAANASATGDAAAPVAPLSDTQVIERQTQIQRDEMLIKTAAGLIDLPRDSSQRLQGVIAALPAKVWLKELEFSGARGLRITGGALDAASLAEFSRQLGQDPVFKGLPLQVFVLEAPVADAKATNAAANAAPDASASAPDVGLPVFHGFVLSSVEPVAKETR